MNGFTFSKLARKNGGAAYAVCSVPTNLANWADQHVTGNLMSVNLGASEVGVYFTRTNPLEPYGLRTDSEGYLTVDLDTRAELTQTLEAMKIAYAPGNEALLGLTTDFVPFDDMNYLTIVTAGVSKDIDVFVQMLEQRALQ